jgi:hypothetical protein
MKQEDLKIMAFTTYNKKDYKIMTLDKKLICSAYIMQKDGDEWHCVLTSLPKLVTEKIFPEEVLIMHSSETKGLLYYQAFFKKCDKTEGKKLKAQFQITGLLEQVQRRADIKVKLTGVSLPIQLKKNREFEVNLCNISAGGMLISTEHILPIGQTFSFSYELPTEVLEINAEILRIEPLGINAFQYGCKFYDMTDEQMGTLRKHIYQLQLEHRNEYADSYAS